MLKVIKIADLSRDEFALASFLQGGINKKSEEKILIDVDIYLEYTDEEYEYCNLWDLVNLHKDSFDGLAVYDILPDDVSINMAATACAVDNLLGVPRTLIDKLDSLPVLFDAKDYAGSNAERQETVFELYKGRLNPKGLVHQVVVGDDYHIELRDFSIAKGYFCFFTDENEEDISFRHRVLEWANRNIAIYGWTTNEIAFLKDISSYGCYVVPMDWSTNHSYFSPDNSEKIALKQKHTEKEEVTPGKHYLTIVVSDGDNIQWLERNFATNSTFGQRLRSNMDYKMNWTISPSMVELCPLVMQGLYNKGRNDCFITGVSGIGYTNLLTYPREHLEAYMNLTDEAMKYADLREMCMLDNTNMLANMDDVHDRIDVIAAKENVSGVIWEMDPDRYEDGRGRVFFSSNGKPFVSVRLSLWHPSNRPENVNRDWLDGYIDRLNRMPVSPNSIDGYTVLNIHPWTVSIEDLDYVMSKLDDHIETLYVKDFLEALRNNIPHEDAIPRLI